MHARQPHRAASGPEVTPRQTRTSPGTPQLALLAGPGTARVALPPGAGGGGRSLLVWQRAVGNRAVRELSGMQRKLTVGPATDSYEREADHVAARVVRRLRGADGAGPPDQAAGSPGQQAAGATGRGEASRVVAPGGARGSAGGGLPLDAALGRTLGLLMGADFSRVRVHTGVESDLMCRSVRATAFTTGRDVFFRERAYDPATSAGQELIAHELTHVVQQEGRQVRHDASPSQLYISSTSGHRVQRKFGFEIEVPILFTELADTKVTSVSDATTDIPLLGVPQDPGLNGHDTHLADYGDFYLNVDHSRTLNPLYDVHLVKYAADRKLDANALASLKAATKSLMPSGASIVEVVTTPWDETELSPPQARQKIKDLVGQVKRIYDAIAGDREASAGGNFRFGSGAENSSLFQPRLGYFHATYGVKLAQIPRLFEETTRQATSLEKYALKNVPQREHAQNVRLTSASVPAAKVALGHIKAKWPGGGTLSEASEADFLGFLTLLANYFLLMRGRTGGEGHAKNLVGMHYYKTDLYDAAHRLPSEVIDPLDSGDTTLLDAVVGAISSAVGVSAKDTLNGSLGRRTTTKDFTVAEYLHQIFRGKSGVIKAPDGSDAVDAGGQTFRDPVLAHSINPYSSKLGPDVLGPRGAEGIGVVLENRHLEYLNPKYGKLTDEQEAKSRAENSRNFPPKNGPDTRTPLKRAKYDSIGAREKGPAKRPIGEWESIMMSIYQMIKNINSAP